MILELYSVNSIPILRPAAPGRIACRWRRMSPNGHGRPRWIASQTTKANKLPMSKQPTPDGGRALVIVESPAKARTISKFLGRGYQVEASIGHVRDLPNGAKEVPEKVKGEPWAYLGVNVGESFTPDLYCAERQEGTGSQTESGPQGFHANSIWRRTKTAKERPSAGISTRFSSPRSRSIGWSSTRSPRRRSRTPWLIPARSTTAWSEPKRHGESSIACTATKCLPCCGGRSAAASPQVGCRVSRSA